MVRPRMLFIIALSSMAPSAIAQQVSYLGRGAAPDSAVIEDSSRGVREVRKGDVVADVGELKEVDDREIVFDRLLSKDEREELQRLGMAAPDVRRLRVARRAGIDAPEPSGGAAMVSSGE
jgi:hypothetical protein